jgi:hypothetical protein
VATNQYERAVIEAARSYVRSDPYGLVGSEADPAPVGLAQAVAALDAYHAKLEPKVTERGWHEVAEGDHLKSVKNQKFYLVVKVLKVRKGYEITLKMPTGELTITRPTAAEPSATVRRGGTGDAVDLLTHVFSSGGR